MQNIVNTSTHINKTPTQLSKHPHITKLTHTHSHTLQNELKHLTRYTPNEIDTIHSSTLSKMLR